MAGLGEGRVAYGPLDVALEPISRRLAAKLVINGVPREECLRVLPSALRGPAMVTAGLAGALAPRAVRRRLPGLGPLGVQTARVGVGAAITVALQVPVPLGAPA